VEGFESEVSAGAGRYEKRSITMLTTAGSDDEGPEVTFEQIESARSAFAKLTNWRRTSKGSLIREYEGERLTVFWRQGKYCWCIDDGDGPRFSRDRFDTEAAALASLSETLVF